MRPIVKSDVPPDSIRDYLLAQQPIGHGLDYSTFSQTGSPLGGSRGGQLCRELIRQQFGLCAYTGAGIDDRIGRLSDPDKKLRFIVHNEHLQSQSACKADIQAEGKVYGEVVGEDMDHRNIVAALLVAGGKTKVRKSDLFGAAHRENEPVPVLPTDPTCETRFAYDMNGSVSPASSTDAGALETIKVLNLQNGALSGWRKSAVDSFFEVVASRADLELIIEKVTLPQDGKLPEYCFVLRQVAQMLLDLST